jgi:hypothetical protein
VWSVLRIMRMEQQLGGLIRRWLCPVGSHRMRSVDENALWELTGLDRTLLS